MSDLPGNGAEPAAMPTAEPEPHKLEYDRHLEVLRAAVRAVDERVGNMAGNQSAGFYELQQQIVALNEKIDSNQQALMTAIEALPPAQQKENSDVDVAAHPRVRRRRRGPH